MIEKNVTFQEINMMEDEELFRTEVFLFGQWEPIVALSNRDNAKRINDFTVAEDYKLKIRIADGNKFLQMRD